MMTNREVQEIEARSEKASPGPWTSFIEGRDQLSGSSFIMTGPPGAEGDDIEFIGATADEQDFIARARQDIPRLLAEVKRLRARSSDRFEDGGKVNESELQDIEKRAVGVSPGPWTCVEKRDTSAGRNFIRLGPTKDGGGEIEVLGATASDREFIAHSRQDIQCLIAEIRRLTH
jgi:hypothetical protein